jgi:chromate transporter
VSDRPDGAVAEVAAVFLKLGVIGFGGPAAHVALMRAEVVDRRAWVDDAEFMDLMGATNLIPGPNSTELAIHLGHRRAGWPGLLAAGTCFIAPAVLIVGILAWAYERYATAALIADLQYGILPMIIAIVAFALYGLGRTALKGVLTIAIACAATAAYLVRVPELLVLFAAGVLPALWVNRRSLGRGGSGLLTALPLALPLATTGEPVPVSLRRLFLVFVEIGGVLFGSGYVLLAFLQSNLVERNEWLTNQQLLDAVAVGQITPGPVFSTATFVGWQVDGVAGAAVATVGIFLPAFVFVALLGRIVPWARRHPTVRAVLAGVTAASLGLMAGVLVELADTALTDVLTVLIAVAALAVLLRAGISSLWLILAGTLIGIGHGLVT